ncbi:MAG: hypothetical protein RLZZ254_882 [Actinomycetota bacterium]
MAAKIIDEPRQYIDQVAYMRSGNDLLRDQRSSRIDADTVALGATDVDSNQSSQDSMRALSSFNVLRMRFSARRLTKPGSGSTNSISSP